ncbi:uncharacterized protein STEHIDRAFT_155765 [Stereum hirsutum FP-91666 SS1]|uniref:uncharacterized protein n=1 Tax=Stereum hirsutum (strain FP-91666) TaxID=721885 RepID=UPI000440A1D7|nr:uncharacterized protein STEHIDRAFT_155765 [Stereum hirsutum FP-91666 SS1]EIM88410.1 hypothetical protein STEHIDRAFT_155765 [Stereum hirsutum FP-91666 SS1]
MSSSQWSSARAALGGETGLDHVLRSLVDSIERFTSPPTLSFISLQETFHSTKRYDGFSTNISCTRLAALCNNSPQHALADWSSQPKSRDRPRYAWIPDLLSPEPDRSLLSTTMTSASRLLSVLALTVFVSAEQLRVLHRLFHPSLDDKNFFERGTLSLDPFGQSSFEAAQHLDDDLQAFASIAQPLHDALYQVAFAPADPDAPWDVSSVKACFLPTSTEESFVIHLTNAGKPYALDYFVSPTPHDGACPTLPKDETTAAVWAPRNVTITASTPTLPPLPELRTPPPLSAQGEPVKPPPEKSFIQKYWVYIVLVLFAMSAFSPFLSSTPAYRI